MSNVIIRNIAISKVLAENGDAIGVRKYPCPLEISLIDFPEERLTNVWIDYVDVSLD
jgi:hypothetical protein